MLTKTRIWCSNPKCRKELDLTSTQLVSLTIYFRGASGVEVPSLGRVYCNQTCYDEMISNVNVDVPPMMQVEITQNKRVSENPTHYLLKCRQRFDFKVA